MTPFDPSNENLLHYLLEVILAALAFIWRLSVGRLEKSVDAVKEEITSNKDFTQKDLTSQRESCSTCRVENEKRFALRGDLIEIKRHIDTRFDQFQNQLQKTTELFLNRG